MKVKKARLCVGMFSVLHGPEPPMAGPWVCHSFRGQEFGFSCHFLREQKAGT